MVLKVTVRSCCRRSHDAMLSSTMTTVSLQTVMRVLKGVVMGRWCVCHDLAMTLSMVVVDSLAECHTRTAIWGRRNTDLPGRLAGSTCQTARYRPPMLTDRRIVRDSYASRGSVE